MNCIYDEQQQKKSRYEKQKQKYPPNLNIVDSFQNWWTFLNIHDSEKTNGQCEWDKTQYI